MPAAGRRISWEIYQRPSPLLTSVILAVKGIVLLLRLPAGQWRPVRSELNFGAHGLAWTILVLYSWDNNKGYRNVKE